MSEQPFPLAAEAAALLAELSQVESCLSCIHGCFDLQTRPSGAVRAWFYLKCRKRRYKARTWLPGAYRELGEVSVSRASRCPDYRQS
jgi:hypothetical protein